MDIWNSLHTIVSTIKGYHGIYNKLLHGTLQAKFFIVVVLPTMLFSSQIIRAGKLGFAAKRCYHLEVVLNGEAVGCP